VLSATDVFAPEPWPVEAFVDLSVRDLEQLVADATEEIHRRRPLPVAGQSFDQARGATFLAGSCAPRAKEDSSDGV
jgi:hypothetical protein